jgi:hypothetical protein
VRTDRRVRTANGPIVIFIALITLFRLNWNVVYQMLESSPDLAPTNSICATVDGLCWSETLLARMECAAATLGYFETGAPQNAKVTAARIQKNETR